MPWPSLVPPVAGTVITVAREVAMNNDPLAWLRLLTGNADPPGPHYVVVATGSAATAWAKVSADELGPGAAVGNLGYAPVNRAGDQMNGALAIANAAGSPDGTLYFGPRGGTTYMGKSGARLYIAGAVVEIQNALAVTGGGLSVTNGNVNVTGDAVIARAAPASNQGVVVLGGHVLQWDGTRLLIDGHVLWHDGNDGSGSGLDADFLRGMAPGNAPGNIPMNNSAVNEGLIARRAENVAGLTPTPTPTPNSIPIANASGLLDAWVTPAALPAGFGSWAPTAAEIPAGFARYTAANGRLLAQAGSAVSGVTFGEGANGGTAWTHTHTDSGHSHANTAHTHGASALGVAGHTGAPNPMTASVNVTSGAGGEVYVGNHSHDATADGGTMDVNGATDGQTVPIANGVAVISAPLWDFPTHGIVLCRKT